MALGRSVPYFWFSRHAFLLGGAIFLFASVGCKPRLAEKKNEAALEQRQNPFAELESATAPTDTAGAYPLRRAIHSSSGQTLEGEILAKEGDEIRFRRDIDGKEFDVSLFQLNVDDQLELANLPEEPWREAESAPDSSSDSESRARPSIEDREKLGADLFLHESFPAAKSMAKETGRPILLIFTGIPYYDPEDSESVSRAAKAKRESESAIRTILGDTWFESFANRNLELVHINFLDEESLSKEQKKANNSAAGMWGVNTYPLAILVNENDYEIARITDFGSRGANYFLEQLEEAMEEL